MSRNDGKKPSGAAFRKQRRIRDEQAAREEALRRAAAGDGPLPHLAVYAAIGDPPDDPIRGAIWSARIGRALLAEVVTDPILSADKRRAQGTALLKALANVTPRASYEARFLELERRIYGNRHDDGDGLEDLDAAARTDKPEVTSTTTANPAPIAPNTEE